MHPLMSLDQCLIFAGLAFNCYPVIYALLHDNSISYCTAIHRIIVVNILSIGYQVSSLFFYQWGGFESSRYLFRLFHPAELTVDILLHLDYTLNYGLFIFIDGPILSLFFFKLRRK